jgi:hypothetical protein
LDEIIKNLDAGVLLSSELTGRLLSAVNLKRCTAFKALEELWKSVINTTKWNY